MKLKIIFFLFFAFIVLESSAQLSASGKPWSFDIKLKDKLTVITLPSFDIENEIKNEGKLSSKKKPFRFAKLIDVAIHSDKDGKWTTLPDGRKIWRLTLRSTKALSLNFTFSYFHIPDSSMVFVYNPDKTYVIGGFTSKNNNPSNILSVAPVAGDEITIEYNQSATSSAVPHFEINQVGHDYKGILGILGNQSVTTAGVCNFNINCSEGDAWQMEKHAVCKIIINNREICSGSLINNTQNDGTAYFLSANHCITSATDAQKTVFYFNYEATTCDGSSVATAQTLSGSQLMATAPNQLLDFALVKLNTTPPANYLPYYAGWDRRDIAPLKGIAIHHPDGDIKKISKENDPLTTDNFGDTYLPFTHWKIAHWDIGTTEGGSSGGPLFDQNHRLVGDLTGGEAVCGNTINDYYQKFGVSWDKYPNASEQLKAWLDPKNLGNLYLNGYDPYNASLVNDVKLFKINIPTDEYCNSSSLIPCFLIQNRGSADLTSLLITYKIDNNTSIQKIWTGKIVTNETAEITFPTIILVAGQHSIEVKLELPNNQTDENHTDNLVQKNFTLINGNNVELQLNTDLYGNETAWELRDSTNTVIYSGANYLSNVLITKSFCLPTGCYSFTITDKGTDGICCSTGQGFYQLKNISNSTLIYKGGAFKSEETIDFCVQKTRPLVDLQVSKIQSPKIKNCNATSISPQIIVKNLGSTTINSFQYRYIIDNQLSAVFNYSNSLLSLESTTITIPSLPIAYGAHQLKAFVYMQGNQLDINPLNDTVKFEFINQKGFDFKLNLQTDNFGDETTWSLNNSVGSVLYNGGPYKASKPQFITDNFCLDENTCYNFSIYDIDGVCCGYVVDGYYQLINVTSTDTVAKGSSFKTQEIKAFCTKLSSIENEIKQKIRVYPNPVDHILQIETDGILANKIEILDLVGRTLLSASTIGEQSQIDISSLRSGFYFTRVTVEKKLYLYKIIKL